MTAQRTQAMGQFCVQNKGGPQLNETGDRFGLALAGVAGDQGANEGLGRPSYRRDDRWKADRISCASVERDKPRWWSSLSDSRDS
jgi:hypothetical protein